MRSRIVPALSILLLGFVAYLGAGPESKPVAVRLRLTEADTGKSRGGMVRVFPVGDDKPLASTDLFDRLLGLKATKTLAGWYVVPESGGTTSLPPGRYRVEALSGLETALTRRDLEIKPDGPDEVVVPLDVLFRPEQSRLSAGNTHLHLQGLTREVSDEYLRQIPPADGLKVMFISYLERFKDDASYITNRYPAGDQPQFDPTGVLVNNGEEYRHNFLSYGQGYGHVMFLDLKNFVKPASLGPGITGSGNDDGVLRPGIDNARGQGATIIWCHNTNGHEDVPSALSGRLHALNVFDGSRTGTYEENYYRYLNIGLRLPISTGTDWFLYDYSRVYARVDGKLTVKSWLEAVRAGRNVATNGPQLTLTVNGKELGDTIALDQAGPVRIEARAVGRLNFQSLQLVQNGKIVHSQPAIAEGKGFVARFAREVRVDQPGWFALRIDAGKTKNELDWDLFAHSSPIYVDLAGKRIFDPEAARGLLQQLEEAKAEVRARGKYSKPEAVEKIVAMYEEATQDLLARGK